MKSVVLFTEAGSVYNNLDCDCYDIKRGAQNYIGNFPVISHPPCRQFSRLRAFSNYDPTEYLLVEYQVALVRRLGGIIEHPASSVLFKNYLPLPGQPSDCFGGFSISVNQSWFNYPAEKKTWLYVVGCSINDLPKLPLSFDAVSFVVSSSKKKGLNKLSKKCVDKRNRASTTIEFAQYLLEILSIIQVNKQSLS